MAEKLTPTEQLYQQHHSNPTPYLYLPFSEEDAKNYQIIEGWNYSRQEISIHGIASHRAVDFSLPYGTPVLAPCDGYAMSTHNTFDVTNDDGTPRLYKGRQVSFGLGYFVQIYNPENGRFVHLAHLSSISEIIPFSAPQQGEIPTSWFPQNHDLPLGEIENHPMVIKIEKGQIIGTVGFSGLRHGYTEYDQGMDRPDVPDPQVFSSWDEPHLHFAELTRVDTENGEGSLPSGRRDPYGAYKGGYAYPTHRARSKVGNIREPLFFTDGVDLPKFVG